MPYIFLFIRITNYFVVHISSKHITGNASHYHCIHIFPIDRNIQNALYLIQWSVVFFMICFKAIHCQTLSSYWKTIPHDKCSSRESEKMNTGEKGIKILSSSPTWRLENKVKNKTVHTAWTLFEVIKQIKRIEKKNASKRTLVGILCCKRFSKLNHYQRQIRRHSRSQKIL